jgi:hypothetical protein
MCGILGVVANTPVNQVLYDGLQVLQHRGQDAAGIATLEERTFHLHKGNGLVRDVFVGIALRAAVGARYFLYEWLGLGVEIGGLVGAAAVDEMMGLESSLLMLDLGVGVEVQF